MRRAGRVVAEMHEECIRAAKPGATTLDVDAVAREVLERRGARSNFLDYHGFPAVICTSPNDVIVHGIPDATSCSRRATSSRSTAGRSSRAGTPTPRSRCRSVRSTTSPQRLIDVTRRSLEAAIEQVVDGQPARRRRRRGPGRRRAGRVHGRARVRRARDRHRDARGAADPELRGRPNAGYEAQGGPRARDRADGERRHGRDPDPRRRLDRRHRATAGAPPTSSTPSPSPTTAPRS